MNQPIAAFDADGIFLRTTHPGNYLEHHYGLSGEKMTGFRNAMPKCLVGKADLRDVLPRFLSEWGIAESADEFMDRAFNSGCEIDPEVAEVVKDLKSRGVTCVLATNQDKHRMTFLDQRLDIRSYFDDTFVSCEMGFKKPDHDYFETVGKHYPGRTLAFWDDRTENVEAARMCGWTAFAFKNVTTLRDNIARLLDR